MRAVFGLCSGCACYARAHARAPPPSSPPLLPPPARPPAEAPAKRQCSAPTGVSLLWRAKELGQLHAGALVFAAWVARNESRFPEAVYYCSSDMSEEQLGRADHEQLLGALQSLTSQHLLGQLCGLAPEQVAVRDQA